MCYNITSHDALNCWNCCNLICTYSYSSESKTAHFQDEDGLLTWWRTVDGMRDIEDVL